MTLSNLRLLCRATIPGAKTQVITDAILDLILNEGVKDIVVLTRCLNANKKFDVVAGQYEYDLSSVIGDFLTVDKSGLWWYNGTQWTQLYPKTRKYFDDFRPNWRDMSNANPLEYSIENDTMLVLPPPDTDGTEYFWLYYIQAPVAMASNTSYPFSGTTTEYDHLAMFDMAIIKYAKWVIEPMLNKDADANTAYQEYLAEVNAKANLLGRRADLSADRRNKMRFGRG